MSNLTGDYNTVENFLPAFSDIVMIIGLYLLSVEDDTRVGLFFYL